MNISCTKETFRPKNEGEDHQNAENHSTGRPVKGVYNMAMMSYESFTSQGKFKAKLTH